MISLKENKLRDQKWRMLRPRQILETKKLKESRDVRIGKGRGRLLWTPKRKLLENNLIQFSKYIGIQRTIWILIWISNSKQSSIMTMNCRNKSVKSKVCSCHNQFSKNDPAFCRKLLKVTRSRDCLKFLKVGLLVKANLVRWRRNLNLHSKGQIYLLKCQKNSIPHFPLISTQ